MKINEAKYLLRTAGYRLIKEDVDDEEIYAEITNLLIGRGYDDASAASWITQNDGYIKISNFDYQPIDLSKEEKVTEAVNNIKIGQKVLVQVFKEPIFNKGPRLTTRITLAGKYLVLIPFNNEVCISKKIEDEKKREKLSDLVYAIKNNLHLNNFGFILRTSAENLFIREKDEKKIEKIFVEDLIKLLEKWSEGLKNLEKAKIGTRIMQGDNRIFTIVKDYLSETFDSIIIDDKEIYEQIKEDFGDEYFKDKSLKLYKNDTKTLFY